MNMLLFKVLDTYYYFVFQKILTHILTNIFDFYHMHNSGGVLLGVGKDEGLGWKMGYRHEQDLKEDLA